MSVISVFSKIFEKVMYKRLYAYLECHNILYSLQFGFRQKCSTNHALISIAESIRCSADNKEFGCGIFIDLKKAFDTVNHSILLLKLHHYGVRGKAYEWFQSYLSNRKQFVCVNGHESDSLPLTCGVPQGSVLGPLLFLLYVNDLPNASSLLTFHLFADDTNIYYSCKNLDDLELKLNHELKVVAEWMKSNRLALSILKTNFILFHSKKLKRSKLLNLKIDGVNIKQAFTVKYLQTQPKVVGTLELDHVSPIPPNQCWKISRFFQQKGKKSPDYQHCKWGEGRTCLVSQLFCPGLSEKKI